jgi:biopolymer transport protein ExbD
MSGTTTMMISGGRAQSQEFDINLAPIIDCFTVLIAFVMISAAFASVGILDAGVRAGGTSAASMAPPEVRLTVNLARDHSLKVRVSGKENQELAIGASPSGAWDYETLGTQLAAIKAHWPALRVATIVAENDVEYKDVVKSMEVSRKAIPSVLLGGF